MNGVEILNQSNVYVEEGIAWIFWLCLGIGFFAGLIFAIHECCTFGFDSDCICFVVGFTAIGLLIGLFIFICTIHETDEVDYVEYKVAISDDVLAKDFLDKYEILDQEGKIYTVKEKAND